MEVQKPRLTKTILSRKRNAADNRNLTSNYSTEHSNKDSRAPAQSSHTDHWDRWKQTHKVQPPSSIFNKCPRVTNHTRSISPIPHETALNVDQTPLRKAWNIRENPRTRKRQVLSEKDYYAQQELQELTVRFHTMRGAAVREETFASHTLGI